MRSGKRGRLTGRVVLIAAIMAGIALAIAGAGAASADVVWGQSTPPAGSVAVYAGGQGAA
ncbi:MAG: hypothetical protein QOE61_342 [Micromonosporaceae bacterium]|jgi:hypothetical protein|nr:hypothetical protein [Micromonosporaceae bacterium]